MVKRHGKSAHSSSTSKTPETPLSGRKLATGKSPLSQGRRKISLTAQEDERFYASLPKSIVDSERLQLAGPGPGNPLVQDLLTELWCKNPRALKDVNATLDKALNQTVLLDNPTTHQMSIEKARAKAQQRSKRSPMHLSLRQHRRLGSFHLDPQYLKYGLYLPLQKMWKEYIDKLIAGCDDSQVQSRVLTADLHGASMEVVDSKNRSFIGAKGLMIRETENTFGILTSANKFRVIPKRGSVFMVQLETRKVIFFGNNLVLRSMREEKQSAKKLKPTIELL